MYALRARSGALGAKQQGMGQHSSHSASSPAPSLRPFLPFAVGSRVQSTLVNVILSNARFREELVDRFGLTVEEVRRFCTWHVRGLIAARKGSAPNAHPPPGRSPPVASALSRRPILPPLLWCVTAAPTPRPVLLSPTSQVRMSPDLSIAHVLWESCTGEGDALEKTLAARYVWWVGRGGGVTGCAESLG